MNSKKPVGSEFVRSAQSDLVESLLHLFVIIPEKEWLEQTVELFHCSVSREKDVAAAVVIHREDALVLERHKTDLGIVFIGDLLHDQALIVESGVVCIAYYAVPADLEIIGVICLHVF